MASKSVYTLVAVVGIAASSGLAWWLQNRQVAVGPGNASSVTATPSSTAAPATGAPRAAGVEVAKVDRQTLRDDAQAVGTLRSRQNIVLRPEVAGRVSHIGFADGAKVRKGQLLIQLDDTLQAAEIKQSQAQVSIARANHKRNQELVAQNFVAQRVLEESQAALQVAEAQLALSEARLKRMAILAPFDGTVGLRSVNLGDYVKDGADLINLEDISTLYVDFKLPERFQSRIKRGQSVEVLLDAFPGRNFVAKIEAVDPLLDANGRSVSVRAQMANTSGESASVKPGSVPATPPKADRASGKAAQAGFAAKESGPLRPGMFARVTTVFAVRDGALSVPEEAIVPQGGRQFVIKVVNLDNLSPEAKAALPADVSQVSQRAEVKLGVRRPGRVEILDGVAEGDTVVVAGQQRLQKDATPVRVVELGRPSGGPPAAAAAAPASAPAPTR